jgi:hypothetical protein
LSPLSLSLSLSLSYRVRIIELAMNEEDALDICLSDSYLDAIVALSDAVTANDYITVLTLGDLPDVTRKQVTLSFFISLLSSPDALSSGPSLTAWECQILWAACCDGLLQVPLSLSSSLL